MKTEVFIFKIGTFCPAKPLTVANLNEIYVLEIKNNVLKVLNRFAYQPLKLMGWPQKEIFFE